MDWEDSIKAGENSELAMAYEVAAQHYARAFDIEAGRYHAARRLAALRLKTGDLEECIAFNRIAVEANPADYLAASSLLYAAQCRSESSTEEIFGLHKEWARTFTTGLQQFPPSPRRPLANRKRKIGFISPDFFHRHPILSFFEPILAGLSRDRFEIHLYSCCQYPDATTTATLARANYGHQFSPQSLPEASLQIFHDDLDLLIDLAGHSSNHALMVMATKPCRRQATYLGYPNTTGLSQVDYRIVDAWSDPPGPADAVHTEALVRLPRCAWSYSPGTWEEFPAIPPSAESEAITFGCFNNLAKLSTQTLELWKRVLERVPQGRLLLKAGAFVEPEGRVRMAERMQKRGLPMDRVILQPSLPFADHLRLYRQMDIALDTFPYHGTTTTCEALWMGVPVVTWAGQTHISRVGASLLHQAGLEELVAENAEGYIERAVQLAQDSARLQRHHLDLRARLKNSMLLQQSRFIEDFESLLLQLTD